MADMADITVDEAMDSLVRELEGELPLDRDLSNILGENAGPAILDEEYAPLSDIPEYDYSDIQEETGALPFQLPLQEIGDSTMDLIVKHNTAANATRASSTSMVRRSSVAEYTLADYDLSAESLGSLRSLSNLQEEQGVVEETDALEGSSPTIDVTEQLLQMSRKADASATSLSREMQEYNGEVLSDSEQFTAVAAEHRGESRTPSLEITPTHSPIEEEETVHKQEDTTPTALSTFDGLGTGSTAYLPLPDIFATEEFSTREDTPSGSASGSSSSATECAPGTTPGTTPASGYLSVWHKQDTGVREVAPANGVSPALSAHSVFSDSTAVGSATGSAGSAGTSAPSSAASFTVGTAYTLRPRHVSRSRVVTPLGGPLGLGLPSLADTSLCSASGAAEYSRVSTVGTDVLYSNGEFAFARDREADGEGDSVQPGNESMALERELRRLELSFALEPLQGPQGVQEVEPEESQEDLGATLSTIIDFDTPGVLTQHLEKQLGSGFADFLRDIDPEEARQEEVGKGETVTPAPPLKDRSIDDSALFEQFDGGVEVKRGENIPSPERHSAPSTAEELRSPHVHSPVRVVKGRNNMQNGPRLAAEGAELPVLQPFVSVVDEPEAVEPRETSPDETIQGVETEQSPVDRVSVETTAAEVHPAQTDFPDGGVLFVTLPAPALLDLHGAESHNARFALRVSLDGTTLHTSPFAPLARGKRVALGTTTELSLVLPTAAPASTATLTFALLCKYDKPRTELVEVRERVQVGKRSLFGKRKYAYRTKYVQRPAARDDAWERLFRADSTSSDRVYATATHPLSRKELGETALYSRSGDIPLRFKGTVSAFQGAFTAAFFPRTAAEEALPATWARAQRIAEGYARQQAVRMEGFLLQDGGDARAGVLCRRWFELRGSALIGCHEVSRRPQLSVNLLNVVRVVSGAESTGERNFSNFTDQILLSECLQLVFANGEVITFNVEGGDAVRDQWCAALTESVTYNVAHQPWVKRMCAAQAKV